VVLGQQWASLPYLSRCAPFPPPGIERWCPWLMNFFIAREVLRLGHNNKCWELRRLAGEQVNARAASLVRGHTAEVLSASAYLLWIMIEMGLYFDIPVPKVGEGKSRHSCDAVSGSPCPQLKKIKKKIWKKLIRFGWRKVRGAAGSVDAEYEMVSSPVKWSFTGGHFREHPADLSGCSKYDMLSDSVYFPLHDSSI